MGEKLKKEKEERERQEREKKEEKERKEKERLEKLEKKKRVEKERREKERQERKEKEEKLKRDAATKKEKEEKEAAARKEKEEKDAAMKKEKEDKIKKEQANKKEIIEQKSSEKKKKTSTVITKIKTKETTTKVRKSEVTNDITASSRKIMPAKPMITKSSTPPSSKLKKDENNKKVMETRKAAFAAKTQKSKTDNEEKSKPKKIIGSKFRNIPGSKTSGKASSTLPDEERKVDEKSVAEKVSEAIASGAIDDSRVVKDDDEDKESIVEKDQIEEMETCPVDDLETGKEFVKDNEDDEDDIELQRIKDEDDEVEENLAPVPDIAEKINDVTKDTKKELELKNVPGNLVLEKEKISYSHVKTPDEVDDLPEHEVVVPDSHLMDEIKSEMSGDLEEKIALDENEKETDGCKKELINEKSEGSVEAVRDNEIVEVAVEQKRMQVNATTPLNENLGEDFLKQANEPEFVEDKQYLTTDKDKEIDEKHVEVETEKDVYVGEKDKIDEEINDEAKDSSTKAQEDIED